MINLILVITEKRRVMRVACLIALMISVWMPAGSIAESKELPYFYPFVNPYEATVIPLPDAYKAELPEKIPVKRFSLEVFPERETPEVFWYQDGGLRCSLARQKHEAPMLFIIAGTGAHYRSPNMIDLQKVFYEAGFHVICISSPTHMNFVVNAGEGMPGNTPEDAKDLYRVLEMADAYARKKKVEISGYALTGYSLGGLESAFIAKLDDERKVFNFNRVLMINPPTDVYESVTILDALLTENIPGGEKNFTPWFRDALNKLADDAETVHDFDLSTEGIYRLYRYYPPREDFLQALIGLAFRMSSANMVFTVDVMNGGGYIMPENTVLTRTTTLTEYAMTSYQTSFVDYFEEWFLPYYLEKEPGLTREKLIHRASLYSLETYLKENKRIGMLHNEDDIIMGPGKVEYLQNLLGDRAKVFPVGGHCGNMTHPDVIRFMTDFLKGKEDAQ